MRRRAALLAIVLLPFAAAARELPRQVMNQVLWSFAEKPAATQAELERAVGAYYRELGHRPDEWRPDEVVIPVGEIEVFYDSWSKRGQKPFRVRVRSSSGRLTAGEILYQLHRAGHAWFDGMDHHFFEGLVLVKDGPIPLYRVSVGS